MRSRSTVRKRPDGGQRLPTVTAASVSLTWVPVPVQVFGTSQGKSKAGRDRPSGPLARDHLGRLLPEPVGVSVVDVDQSLLVLSPERTADGHICETVEQNN